MTQYLAAAFMVACFLVIPGAAQAFDQVTVSDLVEDAEAMAGRRVVVEGELVGDYGFRRDGWLWTQLNEDAYTNHPLREGGAAVGGNTGIGIRMPTELGEGLDPPGGYRNRGPLVRASGLWKYHDPQRQGESYLQVESIVIVEPGRKLEEGVDGTTILAGFLLIAAAASIGRTRSRH